MFRLRCLSQRFGRQRSMRISRIWIQLFSFISSSSLILEWNCSKVSYCLSLCFHQSAHFNVVEFFLGYSRRFTIQTDRFCGGTHKQFSLKTVPDRKGILATVTHISATIVSISASVSYNTDILATVTYILPTVADILTTVTEISATVNNIPATATDILVTVIDIISTVTDTSAAVTHI